MTRRLAPILLAATLAAGWLASPVGVGEVQAASTGLTIVSAARYDVQPEHRRVRVTVDLTLTNHLRDTRTKRFYFDHASLTVLPGASGATLSWSGPGQPRARITASSRTATTMRLDLGQRLYGGKSATYRLLFDIVDKGGTSTRSVRIGGSLVRFPVWAYATSATSGSTVRVVFPAGFEIASSTGQLPDPVTDADGRIIFQTGKLKAPLTFYAYLVADRPGRTVVTALDASVGGIPVELSTERWADDGAWSKRVGGLFARALPLLSERTGLPWTLEGGLRVRETNGRSNGGYAGLFDPAAGTVEVAFDASDEVVLHEAAHAWFNGALLADRWANEGFASYYARDIAPALKVKVRSSSDALTPELEAARIPLNAWGDPGDADRSTEDYGYAASLALAREIAERAGSDDLRAVWEAAAATRPDWRGLLDLLEEQTGRSFEDLWRTWVARDADLALLDARAAAQARHADLRAAAGDWVLPELIQGAMRAWQFDQATALMADAKAVLTQHAALIRRAASAGLTVPRGVRDAFERPDGFADAILETQAEMDALDRYESAVAARVAQPGPIEEIGLWGIAPEADLVEARSLFASGDLAGSAAAASSAATAWSGAAEIGRGRLIGMGVLLVAVLLGSILVLAWIRGRLRRPDPAVLGSLDLDA
jgi:hypothetical protein